MTQSTLIPGGIQSIRRRWRALALRWKIVAVLAGLLVAGLGMIGVSRWRSEWPARLVLPNPKWSLPLAFSPDGSTLATISRGDREELAFWEPSTGRKRSSLVASDRRFRMAGTFAPDGQTFAQPSLPNSGLKNFSVDLVEVATGRVRSSFESPNAFFVGLRYREGGATIRLFSTDPGTSTLSTTDVDAVTGRVGPTRTLSCPMPRTTLWGVSLDGRFLAFARMPATAVGPMVVTIWDLDEDREALKLPPISGRLISHAIAFSEDGRILALGLEDGTIQLWDLAARQLLRTLPCPRRNYSPMVLTFSPDGSTLASLNHFSRRVLSLDLARMLIASHLGDDAHVRQYDFVLLDVATGRPLVRTPWEGSAVFAPDGRTLATSHDDSRVRIHDLPARPAQAEAR